MKAKHSLEILIVLIVLALTSVPVSADDFSLRKEAECRVFSGLKPVALEGAQAPGFPPGACFGRPDSRQPIFQGMRVNSAGEVAFFAYVPGEGAGVWIGPPGDLRLAVRTNDGLGFKPSPDSFHLDEKGQVTFLNTSQKENGGLWRFDGHELRQLLHKKARPKRKKGASAMETAGAGMPWYEKKAPFVFGRQGEIAVRATSSALSGTYAILYGTGDDLKPIVKIGDSAPGMPGSKTVFSDLCPLSVAGQYVLFKAALSGPGIDRSDYHGLWLYGPEGVRLVALLRCRAFVGPAYENNPGIMTGAYAYPVALNSSGAVALVARTEGWEEGLWIGEPGAFGIACLEDGTKLAGNSRDFGTFILLLLEDGDLLISKGTGILHGRPEGLEKVKTVPYRSEDSTVFQFLTAQSATPLGHLAAEAPLRDRSSAAWAGRPDDMRLVLRGGDSVVLDSVDTRRISANGIRARGPLHPMTEIDSLGHVISNNQSIMNDKGDLCVLIAFDPVFGVHDALQGIFMLNVKSVLDEADKTAPSNQYSAREEENGLRRNSIGG